MRMNTPKHMEERIRKGFLIFPIEINHEIRWLEYARWTEHYSEYQNKWIKDEWATA